MDIRSMAQMLGLINPGMDVPKGGVSSYPKNEVDRAAILNSIIGGMNKPPSVGLPQGQPVMVAADFSRKSLEPGMGLTEGARPYEGGANPAPLPLGNVRYRVLSPAVKFKDGSVEIAKPGEHHWDAYLKGNAQGKISQDDGWVDNRTGQFLTRSQVDDLFSQKAGRIDDYLQMRALRNR